MSGKAVIKMHIQKIFVILAFNNQLLETAMSLLVQIPAVGPKLEAPVRTLLGDANCFVNIFHNFNIFSQTEEEAERGWWRKRGFYS